MQNKQIKIGSRVRLKEEQVMPGYMTFERGHEFTVYGSSYRGFDLIDDNGNKLDECLFIHNKFELVSSDVYTR
jgi:hypothetical protein